MMNRYFVHAFVAAVILAAPLGGALAQQEGGVRVGGKYYPPCTSRQQDNCVQMREMKREQMMMGKEEMEMQKRDMMRERRRDPSIPRGCSPVTTPCGSEEMRMQGRDMMRERRRDPSIPRGCSPVTTPCE